MYRDFLNNHDTYLKLETFWIELFESVLKSNNTKYSLWNYPYYKTMYSNGNKFWDGNPIFSAKSNLDNRIIRIVQEEQESEEGIYSCWIDKTMDLEDELVIVCELSTHNLKGIEAVIRDFILFGKIV